MYLDLQMWRPRSPCVSDRESSAVEKPLRFPLNVLVL